MSEFSKLPDFDSLPYSSECGLDGCAWRLFDQHGERDQLGTLNLLTPEKVRDAAKDEILCGQTVSLNWGLENPQYSGFGRKTLQHRILDLTSMGFAGSDDDISFCPQHGSHWDTPLHFAHQRYGLIMFPRIWRSVDTRQNQDILQRPPS